MLGCGGRWLRMICCTLASLAGTKSAASTGSKCACVRAPRRISLSKGHLPADGNDGSIVRCRKPAEAANSPRSRVERFSQRLLGPRPRLLTGPRLRLRQQRKRSRSRAWRSARQKAPENFRPFCAFRMGRARHSAWRTPILQSAVRSFATFTRFLIDYLASGR